MAGGGRGARRACVVVDLPFGSYQETPEQAFRNAARIMAETGCAAVKLEGGEEMAETVCFLVAARHSGDGPCRADAAIGQRLGGFRAQGRSEAEADQVIADAAAIAEAGAFALVIRGSESRWRARIPRRCRCRPSASALRRPATADPGDRRHAGLFAAFHPCFVKRYAELAPRSRRGPTLCRRCPRAPLPRPGTLLRHEINPKGGIGPG